MFLQNKIFETHGEAFVGEWKAKWIRTPQVPCSRPDGYGTPSTELLTDYHDNSIIKLSVLWCVGKVAEGFHDRV